MSEEAPTAREIDTPPYALPSWFLSGNVKPLADLERQQTRFHIAGSPSGDHSQQEGQPVLGSELQHNATARTNNGSSESYSMPYKYYLEARDQVLCGLLRDSSGGLVSETASTLLSAEFLEVGYVQALVETLARDVRADLISIDVQDLEDLGCHFERQDSERKPQAEAPDQEEAAPKPEEKESDKKPDSGRPSEPDLFKSLTGMDMNRLMRCQCSTCTSSENKFKKATTYFAAVNPNHHYKNAEDYARNKAALATLLDYDMDALRSNRENPNSPTKARTEPLIIFVRDLKKISHIHKGFRILSRLRDAITERRKCGALVIGIFSWIGPDFAMSFIKKTGAAEIFRLHETSHDAKMSKERRGLKNRETNIRLLKQGLKRKFSDFVDDDVVGLEADWGWKKSRHIDSFLCRDEISTTDLGRMVSLIGARAHGKPKIGPQDIMDVLDSKESRRIRESAGGSGAASDPRIKDLDGLEKELSQYMVTPGNTTVTHDDVVMDPETKATILQLLEMSSQHERGSISGLLSNEFKMTGILFYGPPGTGKTQLCRAMANDAGQTFIALTGAALSNCLVGQTEKLIQAAFSLARKLYPSILFFDEVDSLFYRRESGNKSWERSALNQYLHEMDGLASQTDNAPLVIVATNRPDDLDAAFLRRLPHKVYFGLPSRRQRREILAGLLDHDGMEEINLSAIAKRTKGFSGSDLKNLCGQAILALRTEKRMRGNAHLSSEKAELTTTHFEVALSRVAASTPPEILEGLLEFRDKFGR
ncbi:hypothetical protein TWF481_006274 [Arthrobotrys musiformis]|uniref:AAA+ ATPase domain-containing protein n=1 Tax=Arthrobotrys musiformis TaxID=47236 RepID=A0AAV9WGA0_9PEZI